MNILIAGGTGMIGNLLARALDQRGHVISILSRNPAAHRSDFPASIH
ncbi:MAG: NAD-dependent epimerase/dehydratase family protein, partial [Anaerolineales bacterium]|nr:NAD-dependent epimerase/dehydratase family protein [Anaerolineales bacterium]